MNRSLQVKPKLTQSRWRCLIGALMCVIALLLTQVVDAAETAPSEYDIKAAYLVSILKFVDWPEDKTAGGSTISIGIVGKDPFGKAFHKIEGRIILGKKLVIRRYGAYREGGDFSMNHILFISDSEQEDLGNILSTVRNTGVLTVSDTVDFTLRGGMVYLFFDAGRLGFDVNQKVMRQYGLEVHSTLLKHARNVILDSPTRSFGN